MTVSTASAEAFTLEQLRWKKRVLVVSAPARDDADLISLQRDVAAMSAEFADRDMLLVTLLDAGMSAAGERTLSAAEVVETRAALSILPGQFALRLIGKDGTGKLSSESAVPMTEIFALIDTMPMRRSERSKRRAD